MLHPRRRWADRDPFDQADGETRAVVGISNRNLCPALNRRAFGDRMGLGQLQGLFGQGGDLTRHADDRQGPRKIGRQIDVEDDIAQVVA